VTTRPCSRRCAAAMTSSRRTRWSKESTSGSIGRPREPSAGKRPGTRLVHGRLAEPIAQAVPELPGWLQVGGAIEGGAQGAAQPTSRVNLRPTRWTGIEMPQDLVIRFGQQFLAEKRIGDFPYVTTRHDASMLSSEVSASPPVGRRPVKRTSAATSSERNCARPRCRRDITVPTGIARAFAASL